MRILIFAASLLALSSCASVSDTFEPLSDEQAAAVRGECGRYPVSRMSSSEGRKRIYLGCKRDVLTALDEDLS